VQAVKGQRTPRTSRGDLKRGLVVSDDEANGVTSYSRPAVRRAAALAVSTPTDAAIVD